MITVSPLPAAVIALSTSRRDGLEAVIVIAISVPDEITIKHKSAVSFFILLEFKGSEPPRIGIYADEWEWRSMAHSPKLSVVVGWRSRTKNCRRALASDQTAVSAISFASGTIVSKPRV